MFPTLWLSQSSSGISYSFPEWISLNLQRLHINISSGLRFPPVSQNHAEAADGGAVRETEQDW